MVSRKNIKAALLKKNIQKKAVIDKMRTDIVNIDEELVKSETDLKTKTSSLHDLTSKIAVTSSNIDAKGEEFEFLTTELGVATSKLTDLKKKHAALKSDFNKTIDSVSPSLHETVSKIIGAIEVSANDSVTVNSENELKAVLDTNPGTIVVITHKNGELGVIDNRATKQINARITTIPTTQLPPVINTIPSQSNGRKAVADGTHAPNNHQLDIDFKLQAQEDSEKTKYHLLLNLPTQFVDFVSDQLPCKSYETTKVSAKTIRWSTLGDISSKHALNTDSRVRNKIYLVDEGKAILNLDGDNQKMVLKLNGNTYKCNLTATRKQKTDTWNMEMV